MQTWWISILSSALTGWTDYAFAYSSSAFSYLHAFRLLASLGYSPLYSSQNPFPWMDLISLQVVLLSCGRVVQDILSLTNCTGENKLLRATSWRISTSQRYVCTRKEYIVLLYVSHCWYLSSATDKLQLIMQTYLPTASNFPRIPNFNEWYGFSSWNNLFFYHPFISYNNRVKIIVSLDILSRFYKQNYWAIVHSTMHQSKKEWRNPI